MTVLFPSLDSLIRDALIDTASPDPAMAVDRVMGIIDAGDHAHYLREAIRSRIPAVTSRARTAVTPGVRRGLSTKQTLIRDEYWPAFLRQRLFLANGYKFLSEATALDLREAASKRHEQAAELTFRADQFSSLADVMDNYGASTLSDLDPSVGTELMGRAA